MEQNKRPDGTGKIKIAGKEYNYQILDGVITVEGKPIEEFVLSLDPLARTDLAIIGKRLLEGEHIESPERELNNLYKQRNN